MATSLVSGVLLATAIARWIYVASDVAGIKQALGRELEHLDPFVLELVAAKVVHVLVDLCSKGCFDWLIEAPY